VTSAAAVSRRTRVDKFEGRRRELADAALLALADLGYARTSLRTIAEHTKFSHGLLHYYFTDKVELITYCVRRYKASCVQRYEGGVGEVSTPEELAGACADGLAAALEDAPLMHRLWYDLRSQSMFEKAFRDDVAEIDDSLQDMIWRNVSAYADLAGTPPNCSPSEAYALFDGLFQQALLRYLMGADGALDNLRKGVRALFPRLVG
jgi:AcrR family transcriptional regulator